MKKITIIAHGKVAGSVGPASIEVYITNEKGVELYSYRESIGNASTMYADYFAVVSALQTLKGDGMIDTKASLCEFTIQNEIVAKQLNSELEIMEPGLVPLFIEIHNLRISGFPHLTFTYNVKEGDVNIASQ